MKIGVLEAGPVNPALVEEHGEYGRFFADWLGAYDPSLSFEAWAAHLGEMPEGPDVVDGWIISGSKYGVYEDHDWLPPLKDLIRAIAAARVPLIGVCFGHQVMAEALGGRAEKWPGGWGLGPQTYAVEGAPDWMAAPDAIAINALHQDQVTAPPPDAVRVAGSDFCRNAALLYGDAETPYAISLQPHPEFSDAFVDKLMDVRRDAFSPEQIEEARGRLGGALTRDWAAQWFLDFLRLNLPKK